MWWVEHGLQPDIGLSWLGFVASKVGWLAGRRHRVRGGGHRPAITHLICAALLRSVLIFV